MTKGRCKHCSHMGLKIVCALGLDPVAMAQAAAKPGEDYLSGLLFRIPCDSPEWHKDFERRTGPLSDGQRQCLEQQAKCDKFESPTDAEIAAYEKECDDWDAKFKLVVPLIGRLKAQHNRSWKGVEVCPACGGKLHLQLNVYFSEHQGTTQKHMHGQCETDGCVRWAE